ncbi:MAG: D-glycero-beta-D-manno-heptose-7-phosphate kinase [Candidatus Omnitrophota bacterium]
MTKNHSLKILPVQRRRLFDIASRFSRCKILVLGDFILDQFVWGDVRRISPEAPVPVVDVKRESYMPGGALNTANNIHALKATVCPCGVVGRDLGGRLLLKAMRREGIDTGGVVYDPARPTSIKTRIIAHSQQVVRFDREAKGDVAEPLLRKVLKFIRQALPSFDAVIIEDYGKGVVQPYLLKEIIALAHRWKKPVLVDPKEKHFSYYQGVTVITPNRFEAAAAVEDAKSKGQMTVDEIGRKLLRFLKCQAVLITLGEDGMALFEKNGKGIKIPTAAREVYDVSGAGDTVIAVFGLSLAAGATMQEAALLSNLAAGIVVGKLGTATVSPSELAGVLKEAGA